MDLATWYLVVEMAASTILPVRQPMIGPMARQECQAIAEAIEAEEVPVVASVRCRRAVMMKACPTPGTEWRYGSYCPVFDDEPLPGRPPQK